MGNTGREVGVYNVRYIHKKYAPGGGGSVNVICGGNMKRRRRKKGNLEEKERKEVKNLGKM
jgi:hypothetical protein